MTNKGKKKCNNCNRYSDKLNDGVCRKCENGAMLFSFIVIITIVILWQLK